MTRTPLGKYLRTFLAPTCNPVTSPALNWVLTTIARLAFQSENQRIEPGRSLSVGAVILSKRGEGVMRNTLFAAYVGPISDGRQVLSKQSLRKYVLNRFSALFKDKCNSWHNSTRQKECGRFDQIEAAAPGIQMLQKPRPASAESPFTGDFEQIRYTHRRCVCPPEKCRCPQTRGMAKMHPGCSPWRAKPAGHERLHPACEARRNPS